MRHWLLPALLLMAACDEPAATPPDRTPDPTATLPYPSAPDTVLPDAVETLPVEEGTAPPGALFGGDLCAALDDSDFGDVAIDEVLPLSVDSCQYTVGDGIVIVVKALSEADFVAAQTPDTTPETAPDTTPGTTDPTGTGDTTPVTAPPVALSGIGEEAFGIDLGDQYRVVVQVDNGWFSVTAPDASTARALARAAVRRAG